MELWFGMGLLGVWVLTTVLVRHRDHREAQSRLTDPRDIAVSQCLRCHGHAEAGYVTASSGRGRANLGWKTGEPTQWHWRDLTFDSRYIAKPARAPGYRCPACHLIWFEQPDP